MRLTAAASYLDILCDGFGNLSERIFSCEICHMGVVRRSVTLCGYSLRAEIQKSRNPEHAAPQGFPLPRSTPTALVSHGHLECLTDATIFKQILFKKILLAKLHRSALFDCSDRSF
jgi:hypothetical protein